MVKAEPETEEVSLSEEEAEPVRGRGSSPEEEPTCAICMNDVAEVLADAEKEGRGGIGGGLALWVSEQRACSFPSVHFYIPSICAKIMCSLLHLMRCSRG